MKIAVIGGGSTYTPELVQGLISQKNLDVTELALMDISEERLAVVGGFAKRIAAAQGANFRVSLARDRREALQGAAFVVVQLRVGGNQARREDEYLGQRHGLIGQETTGVGGIAKALRTLPVLLDIARDAERLAPDAWLVDFTNPVGMMTQALSQYAPQVKALGVCNVAITTERSILEGLEARTGRELDPNHAFLDTLGLNHLSWHRGFHYDGEDLWPQVLQGFIQMQSEDNGEWDVDTIRALGMIPSYYLQYYYYTGKKLAEQASWPPSRAEEVLRIEADLLRSYADETRTTVPPELMLRGGAHYSTMAAGLMAGLCQVEKSSHVVNAPNRGAVADWPEDWVLEMPVRVSTSGVERLSLAPLPPVCWGLLTQVKAAELLTIEAGVHGDRRALYQALLAHPLGPQAGDVRAVMDDLLETNRAFLPQFWG